MVAVRVLDSTHEEEEELCWWRLEWEGEEVEEDLSVRDELKSK